MKSLIEDISSKQFKSVYLLYGEEAYLKTLYKNKLKSAIMDTEDTMNLNIYGGKGINVKEVIDQAETMPFFADKRLILIENSGFFKNASPELAEYIPQIPSETCMVFVEDEVDKRGKLYKAVKSSGRVVEMGRQNEKALMNWVLTALRREKKNITSSTMELFLTRTGNDMENISKELEKLLCYTMGRDVITSEDVKAICTEQTENKIFEMINAIAEKRQKKALDLYYDLLALKEPPMRILYLITRQFNLLMQVKDLQNQGFDQNTIAGKMKMQSFIIRNYLRQTGKFSLEELKSAVKECVDTEEAVKTGRMNDVMSVELLIVKYSG
ncbi:MAG: DNA polymerase III subunit delta [Lachnospiraceae bacterium]|jgi:DNA polymerase-3 subunit delta|nr:DNA polymerase III subunit delta [Lachnospiraceae bacterium]